MTSTPDLSRLTDGERQILRLLTEGHTAKSIATATGRTEGAVNERLREARRKTGVGSSRELARLLRALENRDEQIGMADDPPPAPEPDRAPRRVRWKGVIIMGIIVTVIAAASALLAPGPQVPKGQDDPLFAQVAAQWGLSPASVRATMATEARDAPWADATEPKLRRRYAAVDGIDATSLRISCRATWCEVLGRSVADRPGGTLKAAAKQIGSEGFRNQLATDALHADVTGSHSDDEKGQYQFAFVAYWHRAR